MQRRSQSSLPQPLGPLQTAQVCSKSSVRDLASQMLARTSVLPRGEPSPSPDEPSDKNMANDDPSDLQLVLAEMKSLKEVVAGKVTVLKGRVTGLEAKNAAL